MSDDGFCKLALGAYILNVTALAIAYLVVLAPVRNLLAHASFFVGAIDSYNARQF